MSLARSTWALIVLEAVAVPEVIMHAGGSPIGLLAAFTGLLAFGVHALRYTLAEAAINRIQTVWLDLRERTRLTSDASSRLAPQRSLQALPSPKARELTGTGAISSERESL